MSCFVANLSKTLRISFYQNLSTIVEVMIKNFGVFFMPHSVVAVAAAATTVTTVISDTARCCCSIAYMVSPKMPSIYMIAVTKDIFVWILTIGDRAFAAASPGLWNSLPPHLRDADLSYSRFRRSLKTFLFG